MIRCPACQQLAGLGEDHTISDAGDVHPSCVCPTVGCAFHEWVTLDGWAGAC